VLAACGLEACRLPCTTLKQINFTSAPPLLSLATEWEISTREFSHYFAFFQHLNPSGESLTGNVTLNTAQFVACCWADGMACRVL